jgi:hypothetical protein
MLTRIMRKLGLGRGEGQFRPRQALEDQMRELKEQMNEASAKIEALTVSDLKMRQDLKSALDNYKSSLVKENPEILPELIVGETVEEIEFSLARAKELTERVKAGLEARKAEKKVPGGAPVRQEADPERMSTHEKIVYGLRREGR